MKLKPKQTFLVLAAFIGSFLISAVWLATRSIGRVESVQHAADELEVRNVRIGARVRAQVHRLSSSMLRYQVSGAATYRERFLLYQAELNEFLTSNEKYLDTDDEKRILAQLRIQLKQYDEGAVL